MFRLLPPSYLAWASRVKARRAYYRAIHQVPAYRQFLHAEGSPLVPETDKENYIKPYETAARCVGGSFVNGRTMIDESSGSTGTPYNWIRSEAERHIAHRNISFFARYCFGSEPIVTINAFSMGAWATGFNMTLALNHNGIVKSTGPVSALFRRAYRRKFSTSFLEIFCPETSNHVSFQLASILPEHA